MTGRRRGTTDAAACGDLVLRLLKTVVRLLREGVSRRPFSTGSVYEYQVEAIRVDPRILARMEYAARHGRPADGEDYDPARMAAIYADLGVRPDVEAVEPAGNSTGGAWGGPAHPSALTGGW